MRLAERVSLVKRAGWGKETRKSEAPNITGFPSLDTGIWSPGWISENLLDLAESVFLDFFFFLLFF